MDIEAINNEHNIITRFPDGEEAEGYFGVAKCYGDIARIFPDEYCGNFFELTREEARALGAALLEITKEHK